MYHEQFDLHITVELNTPYADRNDMVGGFYAKDTSTGYVYLMHSGRIGGGTKGIGRLAFLTWLAEMPAVASDGRGKHRDGFIVMPVQGNGAASSLKRYIEKIAAFKAWARNGEVTSVSFERKKQKFLEYFSEARGQRQGYRAGVIDYISRHGDVVDALHAWRNQEPISAAQRIVKNGLIDLGVGTTDRLSEVYEVKTACSRSELYTAIGQLIVHGVDDGCKRFLVIPVAQDRLPLDIELSIKKTQIKIIRYKLEAQSVILPA